MNDDIEFDVIGIAEMIKRDTLIVPSNQREYAWKKDLQVKSYLQDINKAILNGKQSYFLGTIVLTRTESNLLEIADGQQRLATTTMVLAAIRDWFVNKGLSKNTQAIENDYLCAYDMAKDDDVFRLTLNLDDNDFFINNVIQKKHHRKKVNPVRISHHLIAAAFASIKDYIDVIEKQNGESYTKQYLIELIEFLKVKVRVVKLVVNNEETAFTLFETLNDRGLKTSQADLVKNHLFRMAGNRLEEAQNLWSSIKSSIETISDTDDDITMDFLRAGCVIMEGTTTKKEVFQKIQDLSKNKSQALHVLSILEELSKVYSAILNPEHQIWNGYPNDVRESISIMTLLGVTQIRPLMLCIGMYFNEKETNAAFKKLISWSVRFMVMGIRGGRLDEGYSRLANKIYKKEIKNSVELTKAADSIVISDSEFQTNFEVVSVGVEKIARYYLRALENKARNEPNPELIPNTNTVINLEHIMPKSLGEMWSHINPEVAQGYFNRLGNLALMKAEKNEKGANKSFENKQKLYKESVFQLTNQLAELPSSWDISNIENRQKKLAELAVKTWPL